MGFESDYQKHHRYDEGKLRAFGFEPRGSLLFYSISIHLGEFRSEIAFDGRAFSTRVYDVETDDEYLPYRKEGPVGEFVASLREEVGVALREIDERCGMEEGMFLSPQAQRLASLIESRLGVIPEQTFADEPHFGVFRDPITQKWFGLIMGLPENRLHPNSPAVEVINLKADPSLERIPPIYPAYHMSKALWITVPLDDSMEDEALFELVGKSLSSVREKHKKVRK